MERISNDSEFERQSIVIRQIDEDSWRDYERIRHEMLEKDPAAFPMQAFANLSDPEEKWRERIRQGDVLLAYDHERPIGMIRVTYSDDTATVRNMYTNNEYRGQGLGKQLMVAGMSAVEVRDMTLAELEVEDTQLAARAMYTKFGFSEVGSVPNERGGCMITMQKNLREKL